MTVRLTFSTILPGYRSIATKKRSGAAGPGRASCLFLTIPNCDLIPNIWRRTDRLFGSGKEAD
jgi:hypothetical protein